MYLYAIKEQKQSAMKMVKEFNGYKIRFDRNHKSQNSPGAWIATKGTKEIVLGEKTQALQYIEFCQQNPGSEYNQLT
jgi:hypothetical protein